MGKKHVILINFLNKGLRFFFFFELQFIILHCNTGCKTDVVDFDMESLFSFSVNVWVTVFSFSKQCIIEIGYVNV
jgi:hypothetical protein